MDTNPTTERNGPAYSIRKFRELAGASGTAKREAVAGIGIGSTTISDYNGAASASAGTTAAVRRHFFPSWTDPLNAQRHKRRR